MTLERTPQDNSNNPVSRAAGTMRFVRIRRAAAGPDPVSVRATA